MEGLEISEIKFSEVLKASYSERIDSDFFKKEFLVSVGKANERPLSLLCEIKSGTTPVDRDENLKEGVILLKTNNIRNNIMRFTSPDDFFFISSNINKKMKATELLSDDILINIVGATTDVVGRCSLMPSDFPQTNITQAMSFLRIKAEFTEIVKARYLFIFLISRIGHSQIKRIARPTGQFNMNLQEVGSINIFLTSIKFQEKISSIVDKSETSTKKALFSYMQAEAILLSELGLKNITPNTDKVNIKSFQNSFGATGRLDAEYYQKKYEVYESRIKEHKKGFTTIKHEYDLIATVSKRNKSHYNYIEIGDVNVSDGSGKFNRVETSDLPANAKYEVKRGDLLISTVRPNRGAVTIIDFDADDLIVSGAFTVLREKEDSIFSNETLKVLLRTKIYSDWLLKFNIGTQYPVIKDEDILNLPIPKIEQSIQKDVASLVQESFSLKAESERLLDVAKKAVEMAIEHNEETAIKFLTMETK